MAYHLLYLLATISHVDRGETIRIDNRACSGLSVEGIGKNVNKLLSAAFDYLFRANLLVDFGEIILGGFHLAVRLRSL